MYLYLNFNMLLGMKKLLKKIKRLKIKKFGICLKPRNQIVLLTSSFITVYWYISEMFWWYSDLCFALVFLQWSVWEIFNLLSRFERYWNEVFFSISFYFKFELIPNCDQFLFALFGTYSVCLSVFCATAQLNWESRPVIRTSLGLIMVREKVLKIHKMETLISSVYRTVLPSQCFRWQAYAFHRQLPNHNLLRTHNRSDRIDALWGAGCCYKPRYQFDSRSNLAVLNHNSQSSGANFLVYLLIWHVSSCQQKDAFSTTRQSLGNKMNRLKPDTGNGSKQKPVSEHIRLLGLSVHWSWSSCCRKRLF